MKEYNFYPPIEPFKSYLLPVGDIHKIYVEECGNPNGEPIIFLHGGPGSGVGKKARRFFNPEYYHIILFDQRACGRSIPFVETKENNIFYSMEDIESIRKHIGIDKINIFAGSFGTTLALTYAINYPQNVKKMILQGIFLAREKDLDWYFKDGLSEIYPDEFKMLKDYIKKEEQDDLLKAYHRIFTSDDKIKIEEAAKIWSEFQLRIMESENKMSLDREVYPADISLSILETHYFYNKMFWNDENYILNRVDKIKDIPIKIAHGRFDVNTRVGAAYELENKLNNCEFKIVENTGHSPFTEKMSKVLLKFLEDIKEENNGK